MRARLDLSQEGRVIRMSKAILVMDMPSSCAECQLILEDMTSAICFGSDVNTIDVEWEKKKPTWCPLREVPQKKDNNKYYALGYNACIDEILGGGE